MKVLIVKTSSMGDIIQTLPALTDAQNQIPEIRFDWLVEEGFVEIPRWHNAVDRIIPVALRRWRHQLFAKSTREEWRAWRGSLARDTYSLILDAQGLIKSALYSYFAKGPRAGLNKWCTSDYLISRSYHHTYGINKTDHAIVRMRSLFSQALGYPMPETEPDFSINKALFPELNSEEKYIVLLHGTSWSNKLWPERHWAKLADMAADAGYQLKMSWISEKEKVRIESIKQQSKAPIDMLPEPSLDSIASLLAHAKGVIAVDTGLGHLAAALDIPTLSIYGPTNPYYTGALGRYSDWTRANMSCAPCLKRECVIEGQKQLQPLCMQTISPEHVWEKFIGVIADHY